MVLFTACAPRKVAIGSGQGDPQDAWSKGVYAFGRKCASCHGDELKGDEDTPPLVGDGSLGESPPEDSERTTPMRNAGDLIDYIRANMPPLEAGRLGDEDLRVITHYILSERGVAVPEEADLPSLRGLPLR